MNFIRELLTNPLFIIKNLQKESFRKHFSYLKGVILDVGCGMKPYQKYVEATSYIGIDASFKVSQDVVASSEFLPFESDCFDGVICTEVLEHLKEPQRCLSEIRRVLKPGGTVYLSVPQNWGLHYEPHDYWRFTRYGLEFLLEESDFKIVSVERIGGVFSCAGQELIDAVWAALVKIFSFLGPRWAERVAMLFVFLPSFIFYIVGKLADGMDKRFAIGWAIVGRR